MSSPIRAYKYGFLLLITPYRKDGSPHNGLSTSIALIREFPLKTKFAILQSVKTNDGSLTSGKVSILRQQDLRSSSGIFSATLYKHSFHDENFARPSLSIIPNFFPLILVAFCIRCSARVKNLFSQSFL